MSEPMPPENVRAIMADGTEIPVECTYRGYHDGIHRWVAVWALPEVPVSVKIGMLPAHTKVGIKVVRP